MTYDDQAVGYYRTFGPTTNPEPPPVEDRSDRIVWVFLAATIALMIALLEVFG